MFIYLAHAYRHKDRAVEDDRIRKSAETAGSLILYGKSNGIEVNVLAPVLHNSTIYRTNNFSPEEMVHTFKTFDFFMLAKADIAVVLTLLGWKESVGVQEEIRFCTETGIPVRYLDYEDRNNPEKLAEIISLGRSK